MNWRRYLAWSAWILFVLSFFLPSHQNAPGWFCALWSVAGVHEAYSHWNSFTDVKELWERRADLHLASLTLANIFMIVSPFLFLMASRKVHFSKWVQLFNFAAFAAVGSFFLLLGQYGLRGEVRIGYYVWTTSFLLLFLSMVPWRKDRTSIATQAG